MGIYLYICKYVYLYIYIFIYLYIYIYIYMTRGGLCPGEDFAWCFLCRRLAGCHGVYFPSRRFWDVDNKCMYVARLQLWATIHHTVDSFYYFMDNIYIYI